MKFATKLMLLISLATTFAYTQIQPGTFKHIIIVVQENRTPDNLFGSGPSAANCSQEHAFEPGVDIVDGGYGWVPLSNTLLQYQLICNTSLPLSSWDTNITTPGIVDPTHLYETGWVPDYDGGNQDGFCHEYTNYSKYGSTCPPYSYVQRSDVQPYFDIATTYGFANYMFQTNEGPSFPAHQSLFTGTSAPTAPHDSNNYYLDFAAELDGNDYGCPITGTGPKWAYPDGSEHLDPLQSECYPHDSLVTDANDCSNGHGHNDFCDRGIATWGYYLPPVNDKSIWDAPRAIPEVCYGQNSSSYQGNACGSGPNGNSNEWADHLHIADKNGYSDAPIFDDLYNCNKPLPAISWVIPDLQWSDHPIDGSKTQPIAYGPSWVGDIIDAVGQACSGKYWNTNTQQGGEPTAVIVVWDDWGGWFDHIKPWAVYKQPSGDNSKCTVAPNGWGCGYTSGFRVPLLVVSPYTGTASGQTYSSYVSGACGPSPLPSCPNFGPPTNPTEYVHDFGSILAFTEYNFNMPPIDGPPDDGYADFNAPDWQQNHTIPPLADFFQLSQPRPFVSITTPHTYTCFQNFGSCTGTSYVPAGPDDDDNSD